MAILNQSRHGQFSQKKVLSVSTATLKKTEFNATDTVQIFSIPRECLVTSVTVLTHEAGNSALKVKVTVGDKDVIAASPVDVADKVDKKDANIMTKTGIKVSVTPSLAVSKGKFTVIVNYTEYTLGQMTFTNYIE